MYIYIFALVYTWIYTCTCTYRYIYTHVHTYICVCIYCATTQNTNNYRPFLFSRFWDKNWLFRKPQPTPAQCCATPQNNDRAEDTICDFVICIWTPPGIYLKGCGIFEIRCWWGTCWDGTSCNKCGLQRHLTRQSRVTEFDSFFHSPQFYLKDCPRRNPLARKLTLPMHPVMCAREREYTCTTESERKRVRERDLLEGQKQEGEGSIKRWEQGDVGGPRRQASRGLYGGHGHLCRYDAARRPSLLALHLSHCMIKVWCLFKVISQALAILHTHGSGGIARIHMHQSWMARVDTRACNDTQVRTWYAESSRARHKRSTHLERQVCLTPWLPCTATLQTRWQNQPHRASPMKHSRKHSRKHSVATPPRPRQPCLV